MFERNITNYLRTLMDTYPAVAIIGARQVGKTTLAKSVAQDFLYMDLEKSTHYDRITADTEFFFKQHPKHVIFDEVQLFPDLFPALRSIIDESREEKGRFIITGSSSPELLNNISESLAGRIAIIELGTLKANEFYHTPLSEFYHIFDAPLSKEAISLKRPSLSIQQIQTAWQKGGYPEPTQGNPEFFQDWMVDYQQTYINRDIAALFPKLNKVNYRRFISMLGRLSGNIINKSDIARSLNVSQPTITQYLDIANGTFIWRQLLSYENNASKSVVKMPRGHIRDSGLLHSLLHLNDLERLLNDPISGFSFEGFVIEELLKGLQDARHRNVTANYYRTRSGSEVDLILEGNFGILPIEIKLGSLIARNQLKSIHDFVLKNKLPFGILINQSEEMRWISDTILQLPAGCL